MCIGVSTPLKNTTHPFLPSPLLYWKIFLPLPFQMWTSLKNQIFQWTPIILKFFIINPIPSFKNFENMVVGSTPAAERGGCTLKYYSIYVRETSVMILTLLIKYCLEWSMYLVYIYNSYIFNLFLTFLLLLTFIYVFTKFKLVLGHFGGRIKELYMSGKISLTCWRAKCGGTVSLDKLY